MPMNFGVCYSESEPTFVLAASTSKVLQGNRQLNLMVHKISINRNGSTLVIVGSERLHIMYFYGHNYSKGGNDTNTNTLSPCDGLNALDVDTRVGMKVITTDDGPSARFSMAGNYLDPMKGGVLVFVDVPLPPSSLLTKSLTDEDLDELKGCLDLGFGFSYDEIPELCNILPALELCYSVSQKFMDEHQKSPDNAEVASTDSCPLVSSSIANWKVSSLGLLLMKASEGYLPEELSKFINHCNEVKAATAANKDGGQLSIVKCRREEMVELVDDKTA
ncbi:hypothetical protein F2P56_027341 [Juglans regia]|uniref:Uncharacterized protein n=1 Tax=Juglans regia TaxID=51240 RepID=A0A833WJD5_JUGRE|nr:hypothetical protein F2P56_027341 [Juglans regia]